MLWEGQGPRPSRRGGLGREAAADALGAQTAPRQPRPWDPGVQRGGLARGAAGLGPGSPGLPSPTTWPAALSWAPWRSQGRRGVRHDRAGGQGCRPKRTAFLVRPACIVSGSSRGIQAAGKGGLAEAGSRGRGAGGPRHSLRSCAGLRCATRRPWSALPCGAADLSGAGPRSPQHKEETLFSFLCL